MSYTAKVDRELCVSVATCVAIATSTFALDEDGIAVVRQQNGDSDQVILDAAKSCPVDAISIYDENGTKIYPLDKN